MIRIRQVEQYQENNRIEAKKATGGFPGSLWETYSAFANTIGGIILLGVEELPDHSLHVAGLPDPDNTVRQLWAGLNNPDVVSINILGPQDVRIEEIEGKPIVTVEVPRADRHDRPIYLGRNPFTGSYRRNGEGDYRCTEHEVRNMLRDGREGPQDIKRIDALGLEALCPQSVAAYRRRVVQLCPQAWPDSLGDEAFLLRLGAAARGMDGIAHPTAAGLLMLGLPEKIGVAFPCFALAYRETGDGRGAPLDGGGQHAGNLYAFYTRVMERITGQIRQSLGDTPAAQAMRIALSEALSNAVIHANYYQPGGLTVENTPGGIVITNPGGLRMSAAQAMAGGKSDPRNPTLMKLFKHAGIGTASGRGLQALEQALRTYASQHTALKESFNPDRVTIQLPWPQPKQAEVERQAILDYLMLNIQADAGTLCRALHLPTETVRRHLQSLQDRGLAVREGSLWKLPR
nr:putative DNA binding domain-containing protein [bacterium]